MRHMLKLICWMTLFVDVCLILGSAFHGVFGDGNPVATMKFGEFAVTSAIPGGATFLIVVSAWTGVLAGAVLFLMKQASPGAA